MSDTNRLWTVMIYMAGDNNLDNLGIADLREIKNVGSSDKVAIVAQFDRAGNNGHTKRYFLRNKAISSTASRDVVADLGETNTGSSVEFTDFIKWGMEHYEAKHYLVIIWGHGAGAFDEDFFFADEPTLVKRHGIFRPQRELFAPSNGFVATGGLKKLSVAANSSFENFATVMEIAPDDNSRDFLDNVELKEALKRVGRPIDILGMDACLMAMLEVCYQVRESVGITIASQGEQELDGWPYEAFLRRLVDEPDMSPKELASAIIEEFGVMYEEHKSDESTLSACATRELEPLITAVNTLATLLIENLDSDELNNIMLSRYRAFVDDIIESVDLCDFCQLLRKTSRHPEIKNACDDIVEILLSKQFIFARQAVGDATNFSNGLGIYFPQFEVSNVYSNLDFVKPEVTSWGEFIRQFVDATAR